MLGRLDLLVNNASDARPEPAADARRVTRSTRSGAVYETNVVAPLALTQLLLATLRAAGGHGAEHQLGCRGGGVPRWGGYGSAKAALDQLTAVLGAEEPELRVYAVDPGDMRTEMHQAAFPGEDISDRPEPESVVPALLRLLDERPASGRYRAADFLPAGRDSRDRRRSGA